MTEPMIRTQNLSKVFKGRGEQPPVVAVNNVNIAVPPAKIYGFLGPNGAGKSTTLRMILTLLSPTSGSVQIGDQDPHTHPEILRKVGFLVEGATFYPYLSALANLKIVGLSRGGFNEQRARELLAFVGLADKANAKTGSFSTGMIQRLGVAAALLTDPEIVILDEPTNGMDPMGIRAMRSFIRELAHVQGKTVLLTSHILDEVQQTCDLVSIINRGEIVAQGDINTILAHDTMLSVEVESADEAHSVLPELPIRKIDDTHLRVTASREQTPEIVRRLVAAGLSIYTIQPYQRTLEEYFFDVIGEKA